jgi:hypothetical protein
VQPVPGHQVSVDAENLADAILDPHQLDQAELRIVVVEEQIDVAPATGFAAGRGAEQIEGRYPVSAKLAGTYQFRLALAAH